MSSPSLRSYIRRRAPFPVSHNKQSCRKQPEKSKELWSHGTYEDIGFIVRKGAVVVRVGHVELVPHVPPYFNLWEAFSSFSGYHHVGREVNLGEDCCTEKAGDGSGEDTTNGNAQFSLWWSLYEYPRISVYDHLLESGYMRALHT